MELSVSQILKRLKTPQNQSAIQHARNHEDRVKLHTKAVDSKDFASAYFKDFLKWVETGIKLPADKMEVFKGMCQFPLATTALCNSIFDEFEKIFTAQDNYFDVDLLDGTLKDDFKSYLEDRLKIQEYFKNAGFQEFKTQPGCIYVVDVAVSQTTQRPEPYFATVSIQQVWDIAIERNVDGTKRIGFLLFKEGKDVYRCFDDSRYRLFTKTEGGDYRLDIDVPHNLGYTPATFLLATQLYSEEDKSPVARKTAISDSLGDLDWLLAYTIFMRMYETFGPFPITTIPETNCDYTDALQNRCTNGYVSGIDRFGKEYTNDCPACKKSNIVGPGTVFTRPVPRQKEDPQLGNAVEFTSAAVDSLEYITKKIDYLEREIFANNVGDSDTTITKEAVNEDQVAANMEGRKSVLSRIKKDFENTIKFLVDSMGRLRYDGYYVGCTVNMGEQWLLLSAAELTLQYSDKKKAGLPAYMIALAKQQLTQTEYRSNPALRQRTSILELLEPWPDLSISECVSYQLNLLFPDKFFLKLDFAKFVSKFELANGDIVQWGSALDLNIKIEKLTKILLDYGNKESSSAKELPEVKQSAKK